MANITHYYSKKTKRYEIKYFEKAVKDYKNWIAKNTHPNLVINNDDTYKDVFKERTLIRNEIKAIKEEKKTMDDIIIGKITTQCETILDLLKEADTKLTENLETFKPKDPVYEIKFKTKNKEVYDKVMALINKLEGETK